MKVFPPVPEPPGFQHARLAGERWLLAHPLETRPPGRRRPKDFWTPFKPWLAEGFRNLCGYSYLYDPTGGTVDHYISCEADESKAYDWANYRFAMEWINKSKQNQDDLVLDPFETDDEWFEILLPSMQMVMTDKVPSLLRDKVGHTLRRLHLVDDERSIRPRRAWYRMYQEGELTIEGLRRLAPLIAKAVERIDQPR